MVKAIIVTGGCGFIGTYVVRLLVDRGYRVRVIDNLSSRNADPKSCAGAELVRGDLRDDQVVGRSFHGMDCCINMAALSGGIGFFNQHPGTTLEKNVEILSATFKAAREKGLKRMVYVSSSCVFDRCSAHPIKESDLGHCAPPPSGYPFSKLVGESFCHAYYEEFGLEYTIIRPFNVYGPGQLPGDTYGDGFVIPDLTLKIFQGDYPLSLFGDGQQTRSFTHVRDVAKGIVLALESPAAKNEDFNLCGFPEVTIENLARLLWEIIGRPEPFAKKSQVGFPFDIRFRAADISKAKKYLSWEPKVNLTEGLTEYIAWARERMAMSTG